MKSTLKLFVVAGLCAAVVYSCKQNVIKPASTTTTSTQTVAAQIAMSLSKSFQGQNGGANINQGIKSPYAVSHKGPAINGIYDLCGTGTDTTFNSTTLHHDTTVVMTGGLKFVYDCGSAGVNGYHVTDSLNLASSNNTTFFNSSTNVQKYIVKALDNTYKLISIDGSINTTSNVSTLSKGTTTEFHTLVSQYIFNGVTADVSGAVGDFLTGTASYTTTQTDYAAIYGSNQNVTVYHGLITYLGNYMATISIQINSTGPTDTYSINMVTGAMTKI